MITTGTTVVICREPPYKEYGLCVGDIGVVTYVASSGKYSVRVNGKRNPHYDPDRKYGENGDFWIPRDCVRQYQFKKGDRVLITSKTSKYKGYKGTFDHYLYRLSPYLSSNYVELFVDGTDYQPNSRISYHDGKKHMYDSCLRLVETSITLLNEKSEENIMTKLTGYKKVASVKMSTGTYYYALYDETIVAGDSVLVSGACEKVVVVEDVLTLEEAKSVMKKEITAEVKCKVDLSAYEQRVQNRAKAAELRKEMDKKIAEMDELNKYVMYAEKNPELATMLEAYQALV